MLTSVCVFCGSMPGSDPAYARAAEQLGRTLALRSVRLVFGGGATGLMGIVARAALQAGGSVIGVVPRQLAGPRVLGGTAAQIRIVEDFAQRLEAFSALSDGFIALPGALGTLEEIFRMAVCEQLRLQHKPTVLLNVCGFWNPLEAMLETAAQAGFLRPQHRRLLTLAGSVQEALESIEERLQIDPANPF